MSNERSVTIRRLSKLSKKDSTTFKRQTRASQCFYTKFLKSTHECLRDQGCRLSIPYKVGR